MNIENWRRRIDEIDRQLVKLLNERARCAIEIGWLKRRQGTSVYQPEREREILANVLDANGGPLSNDAIRRLFERVMEEARAIGMQAYREADSAESKRE